MLKATYLTNTTLEKAIYQYQQALEKAGCSLKPTVLEKPLAACGLKTVQAVYAKRSAPHFLASAMDGIAVTACDTFGATETTPVKLTPDQYYVVDTGDPIPEGCDAVIMIEDVIVLDHNSERDLDQAPTHSPDQAPTHSKENTRQASNGYQDESSKREMSNNNNQPIMLEQAAVPWQHIRQIGEDFCAGDMLLPSETTITPAAAGLLTAGGINEVLVYRPLTVAIIPTGDEIVMPDEVARAGQIPEYNGTLLSASLQAAGLRAMIKPIVPDNPQLLEKATAESLRHADIVLLLAGSSAGRDDYTSQIIQKLGQVVIHGLAIKPGKPAVLGICDKKPVIGMPGYPVSALTVLEQLVLPVLAKFSHVKEPAYEWVEAKLTRRLTSSLKHKEFIRVRLSFLNDQWLATPMARGASMLASFFQADGILAVDQDSEGLEAGMPVIVRLTGTADQKSIKETISLIGSHDPLLDELADLLAKEGGRLTSAHTGSMGGLMALRRDEALLAPIHLLDPESGEYNLPDIRRLFPDDTVVLIEGFKRMQGLLLPKDNPLQIKGISDLTREGLRYVNRQPGAGTRILLDYLLKQKGIDAGVISGYSREEMTHTAVAAQIAGGTADTGMGVKSAATIFNLDFLPLTEECYDFAVKKKNLNNPLVQRFIQLISSNEIKSRLQSMGGYSWDKPGQIKTGAQP